MIIKTHKALNILLIGVSSPSHYVLWNALSIETLAGDIRGTFGDRVSIIVKRVQQSNDIIKLIQDLPTNIGLVGLSVELGSLYLTQDLVNELKKTFKSKNSKPTFVFGNSIPTYLPDLFLDMCQSALVVRGEGELSLRGIVNHLLQNSPLDNVPSLVYMKNGSKHETPFEPPKLDLLTHAPSLDTMEIVRSSNGSALMETSRGCPWSRCSYCSISTFRNGRLWDSLPLSRVRESLTNLVKFGIKEIEFTDADFIGGRTPMHTERISKISDIIKDVASLYNTKISFRVFMTPQILYRPNDAEGNKRIFSALKDLESAGLSKVYLGIESGCESQIKRYKKGSLLRTHALVLNMLRNEVGVEVDVGFLLFDPDLTLKEMAEDIKFFRENDLLRGNQWPFRPLRVVLGTPLCDSLKETGHLGKFDQNFLNYLYNFSDIYVQKIADEVDKLSIETREIFYTIKTVAKLQISAERQTAAANCATEIVKENALIYLDLLEALIQQVQQDSSRLELPIQSARNRIHKLVDKAVQETKTGLLQDHAEYLIPLFENFRKLE